MVELRRFWVKNYKSLRDVVLDFPTRLTVVAGPSGSGKTALVEAFGALRGGRFSGEVGVELRHGECRTAYVVSDKKTVIADCGADEADEVVRSLLNVVVIEAINWRAVRSPQPVAREEKLLPDASNFVPFLYTVTRGVVPEALVEALRYIIPNVRGLRFEERGGGLLLKLDAANGAELDQTNMPAGALKTLIVETVLRTDPVLVVIDEFENSLHPEAQQFLMDEIRSRGVYAVLTTHSTVPLDYVKTPSEVVLLSLENGETKARRLGKEVEEKLKKHKLTLSELIESGLLET